MARTVDDVLSKLDEIQAELDALRNQTISPRQIIVPGGISDLTDNLGIIRSGGLYALEKGSSPSDKEAIGVFVSATGEYFLGVPWAIGGVNKGVLMFGLDARTGRALFAGGRGVIDDEGISLQGLTAGLTQEATITDEYDDEITRYGNLEMWLPDGSRTPVFGLVYKDDAVGDNFITNGNFEASQDELTGWTASAGESSYFGIALEGGPTRVGKVCMYSDTRSSTQDGETLTAICNAAVTPGRDYEFTFWTRDFYKETIIPVVSNVVIDESNPNFAWGSVANPASNAWLAAGYYSGQLKQKALLRFAVPSFLDVIEQVDRASWRFYVQKDGGLTLGSTTISMRRLIEDYEHTQVTYNKRNTSTSWTTAGASGSGTDREATAIGTLAVSAASTLEGYNDMPLTATKIQEWFDETNTDYSVVVEGSVTSGNNAVDIGMIETEYGSFIEVIERSKYKVEAKWYTGAGGTGSLIRIDTLCRNNDVVSWNKRSIVLKAPTGAASFTLVITGYRGREFQFDDIEVKEIGIVSKLFLSPAPTVQDNLGTRRILTTKKELPEPLAPTVSAQQNAQLGNITGFTNTNDGVSYVEWNHTIAEDKPDRILIVHVGSSTNAAGRYSSSVTYNGLSLTNVVKEDGGDSTASCMGEIWYLLSPPVGTYTVRVTSSAVYNYNCFSIDFFGINQTNPITNVVTAADDNALGDTNVTVTQDESVPHLLLGFYVLHEDEDAVPTEPTPTAEKFSNLYLKRYTTTTPDLSTRADIITTSGSSFTVSYGGSGTGRLTSVLTVLSLNSNAGDMGTGTGVTSGNHTYVVTCYDDSGETAMSVPSNNINNTPTAKVNMLYFGVNQVGTVGRRIYRTEADGDTYYWLADIEDNISTAFVDSFDDSELDLNRTPPMVNTTANRPQMPRAVYIPARLLVSNATLTETVTDTVLISTSAANANDGNTFDAMAWIEGGTYTLKIHGRKETTAGKFDVYIDGVRVSSGNDGYAASGANFMFSISNVAISGSGYHTVRIKINTKNGSSSDYTFGCYGLYFIPSSY